MGHFHTYAETQGAFTAHRESADLPRLAERARAAFTWIGRRPETEIICVGHQAFFWNVLNMGRAGGPNEQLRDLPPVVTYGGADVRNDWAFERWVSSSFANCECRSMWAEFSL